jgi:hypothetical protein
MEINYLLRYNKHVKSMEINDELRKKYSQKPAKSKFLHSADHVLADELSKKMGEPQRFGFYLGLTTRYDHNVLRRIAGQVLEGGAKKPGALFAFLIKKEKEVNDSASS